MNAFVSTVPGEELTRPAGSEPESSLLAEVLARMKEAGTLVSLTEYECRLLQSPRRELQFQIPLERDTGTRALFTGHRIQWNDARGPFKGGIRFHPSESLGTIRALAALMMLKTAVMNLPLGGAKGGVNCNAAELSASELQRLSRTYIRELASNCGPDQDIPAPDMYTNEHIMGWMADEYQQMAGHFAPGIITGKPLEFHGSQGRREATARGGLIVLQEIAIAHGIPMADRTMAIHGYGNIGSHLHKLSLDMVGIPVVAVCDSRSGLYNPTGLPYEAVCQYKQETGSFHGCPLGTGIAPAELLHLDVAFLCLASREGVVDEQNARGVTASTVAEMANGPVSVRGEQILLDQGTLLVPDLLCNGGGVTVSYFEQVQNVSNYYWNAAQVQKQLQGTMREATRTVMAQAAVHDINLRTAAYAAAMERVARAMRARGWT